VGDCPKFNGPTLIFTKDPMPSPFYWAGSNMKPSQQQKETLRGRYIHIFF